MNGTDAIKWHLGIGAEYSGGHSFGLLFAGFEWRGCVVYGAWVEGRSTGTEEKPAEAVGDNVSRERVGSSSPNLRQLAFQNGVWAARPHVPYIVRLRKGGAGEGRC